MAPTNRQPLTICRDLWPLDAHSPAERPTMDVEAFAMHDPRDVHALKIARAEFARHLLDISRADLQCRSGILTIRGQVGRMGGHPEVDPHREIETLRNALRQRPDFREVVMDCGYAH